MIFRTWKEAQEEFYKQYPEVSDDSDYENERIERWLVYNQHEVREDDPATEVARDNMEAVEDINRSVEHND